MAVKGGQATKGRVVPETPSHELTANDLIAAARAGERGKWRTRTADIVLPVLAFVVVCTVWEILSSIDPGWFPREILPPPSEIAGALVESIGSSLMWSNLAVTLKEVGIAFAICLVGGFALGVAIALSRNFSRAVYPLVIAFQSVPRSAFAPLFIAWFGFGISSKVALAVTISFFPVVATTITGLNLYKENELLLMRSLRATRAQTFFRLQLPNAMPTIFAGIKTSLTFAVVGVVFGEMIGANEGIGLLIRSSAFQLRMDLMFSYLVILAIIGVALVLLSELVERRVTFWNRAEGTE
jgi:NitT/TauT family transport system permease protein